MRVDRMRASGSTSRSDEGLLVSAGYALHRPSGLWRREREHLVDVVDLGGELTSARKFGVWLPGLASLLQPHETHELDDIANCHLVLGDPDPDGSVQAGLRLLDGIDAMEDVTRFLTSDDAPLWPPPELGELYVAGIAVLTGARGTFALVESAAVHLQGTQWSRLAGHLYACVATLE